MITTREVVESLLSEGRESKTRVVELEDAVATIIADNGELFQSMCGRLDLTPSALHPTIVGVGDEIFRTGVNWGRIVSFLAFGATLAEHTPRHETIIDLFSQYIDRNLTMWIRDSGGGWETFETKGLGRWSWVVTLGLTILTVFNDVTR